MCTCGQNLNKFVRTGQDIYIGPDVLHSVTWAQCPVNEAYALHGRHGAVRTEPDPMNLALFKIFAKKAVFDYATRALMALRNVDIFKSI